MTSEAAEPPTAENRSEMDDHADHSSEGHLDDPNLPTIEQIRSDDALTAEQSEALEKSLKNVLTELLESDFQAKNPFVGVDLSIAELVDTLFQDERGLVILEQHTDDLAILEDDGGEHLEVSHSLNYLYGVTKVAIANTIRAIPAIRYQNRVLVEAMTAGAQATIEDATDEPYWRNLYLKHFAHEADLTLSELITDIKTAED